MFQRHYYYINPLPRIALGIISFRKKGKKLHNRKWRNFRIEIEVSDVTKEVFYGSDKGSILWIWKKKCLWIWREKGICGSDRRRELWIREKRYIVQKLRRKIVQRYGELTFILLNITCPLLLLNKTSGISGSHPILRLRIIL